MVDHQDAHTYSRARQWIHWLSVVFILTLFPTGFIMAQTLDHGTRQILDQVHLVLGWAVVALAIWRMIVRFRQPVRAPHDLAP